jgi:hypothetical protein
MFKYSLAAAACALACASSAVPALAQQAGLVNVNVSDVSVLNNFLNGAQIAALNNLTGPITVQVPVGVAANVCGVTVAVLHQGPIGGATCTATSGSEALAHAVSRQVLQQTH